MKKSYSAVYALFAITVLASVILGGCGNDDRNTSGSNATGTVQIVPSKPVSSYVSPTTNTIDNTGSSTSTTPSTSTNPVGVKRTAPGTTTSSSTPAIASNVYKDNTYNEAVSYEAPSGTENVNFTFTVKNDTITALDMSSNASGSRQSQRYQQMFLDGILGQVVGQPISSLGQFDRVNGSSLTTPAFNEAVAKLKADAKA